MAARPVIARESGGGPPRGSSAKEVDYVYHDDALAERRENRVGGLAYATGPGRRRVIQLPPVGRVVKNSVRKRLTPGRRRVIQLPPVGWGD
jgi:hypothetical protein